MKKSLRERKPLNSIGIVRLVDELGRLVLPIELRRMLELNEGDVVEFFFDDDNNRIIARKYRTEECLLCKSTGQLSYFKDRFVCSTCLQDISSETL
jgi:transcriptional pleiotropic regulator of transition state genes